MKEKFLQGIFEAYLKSQIDMLRIQDTGAYDALSIERKSTLDDGRCSVS